MVGLINNSVIVDKEAFFPFLIISSYTKSITLHLTVNSRVIDYHMQPSGEARWSGVHPACVLMGIMALLGSIYMTVPASSCC